MDSYSLALSITVNTIRRSDRSIPRLSSYLSRFTDTGELTPFSPFYTYISVLFAARRFSVFLAGNVYAPAVHYHSFLASYYCHFTENLRYCRFSDFWLKNHTVLDFSPPNFTSVFFRDLKE